MLQVVIPESEFYNEAEDLFITTKEQVIQLEHSLVSLSKWESKWKKPFISKERHTFEETIDYIRCMTMTQNVNPLCYNGITDEIVTIVDAYIDDSMTATWFNKKNRRPSSEAVTAEIIYYWMISLDIPFECQKWHLNRLLTLIQVCNVKNGPENKMGKKELMSRNRSLNAARKQGLHTSG
jgi:hypothetical protein